MGRTPQQQQQKKKSKAITEGRRHPWRSRGGRGGEKRWQELRRKKASCLLGALFFGVRIMASSFHHLLLFHLPTTQRLSRASTGGGKSRALHSTSQRSIALHVLVDRKSTKQLKRRGRQHTDVGGQRRRGGASSSPVMLCRSARYVHFVSCDVEVQHLKTSDERADVPHALPARVVVDVEVSGVVRISVHTPRARAKRYLRGAA